MQKGTLAAVAVFAVLLGAVVFTRDRGNVSVGMPSLHLSAIDPSTVTEIDVTGAASSTLKKDASGWAVSDPTKGDLGHPADEGQVKNLLDQLKNLKPASFITDKPEKQAEFEVDATKGVTLKVVAGSGPALTLVFGKATKTGGSYVRNESSPQIFSLPGPVGRTIHREAKGWRKRTFFPGSAADLAKVTLAHEDGSKLALEEADGGWSLAAGTPTPPGFRFDPTAATRIATSLAGLSAADFGDALTDATAGFSGPHLTAVAQKKDGSSVTVQLGHLSGPLADGGAPLPGGQVPVRVDGDSQIYLVAPFAADALSKTVGDLRDTSLVSFNPAAATRLTIRSGAKTVSVTQTNGTWAVTDPKALPAGFEFDPSQVQMVLASIKATRAAKVVDGVDAAAAGLTKPTLSIEVALTGGATQQLAFGSDVPGPTPGQVYVGGSIDKLVYAMPSSGKARFDRGVDLFKKVPRPPPGGGGGQGLASLPPDIRRQIEEQLRKQQAH